MEESTIKETDTYHVCGHTAQLIYIDIGLEAALGLLLQAVDRLDAAGLQLVRQVQSAVNALLESFQAELPNLNEHVAAGGPRGEAAL